MAQANVNVLSPEILARVRALALEQVDLMDQMEAALEAGNDRKALDLARQIVGLEKEITKTQ